MRSYIFTENERKLIHQYIKTHQSNQAQRDLFVDIRLNTPKLTNDFKLLLTTQKLLITQNRWTINRIPKKIKQEYIQRILQDKNSTEYSVKTEHHDQTET